MAPDSVSKLSIGVAYNVSEGVCQAKDSPKACEEVLETPVDYFISSPIVHSPPLKSPTSGWLRGLLAGPILPVGCADPEAIPGALPPGDPIDSFSFLGEVALNGEAITGTVQGAPALNLATDRSTAVWSVDDLNPSGHGTFALLRGGSQGIEVLVDDSMAIQQTPSTLVLPNGNSVVAYARVTGDDQPGELVFKILASDGIVLAEKVVASDVTSSLPQLLPQGDGFLVVYREEGESIKLVQYHADGEKLDQTQPAILSGTRGGAFQVTTGQSGEWVLAERLPNRNKVVVHRFKGLQKQFETEVSTTSLPKDAQVSVGAQSRDGGMMVVWHATKGSGETMLEVAFLNTAGQVVEGPRELVSLSNQAGSLNSHSVVADGRGNFFVFWEEETSIQGRSISGSNLASIRSFSEILSNGAQNTNLRAHVLGNEVHLIYTKIAGDGVSKFITQAIHQVNYQ